MSLAAGIFGERWVGAGVRIRAERARVQPQVNFDGDNRTVPALTLSPHLGAQLSQLRGCGLRVKGVVIHFFEAVRF